MEGARKYKGQDRVLPRPQSDNNNNNNIHVRHKC